MIALSHTPPASFKVDHALWPTTGRLPWIARKLAVQLRADAGDTGLAKRTEEQLAVETGLCLRSIRKAIELLTEWNGWLQVTAEGLRLPHLEPGKFLVLSRQLWESSIPEDYKDVYCFCLTWYDSNLAGFKICRRGNKMNRSIINSCYLAGKNRQRYCRASSILLEFTLSGVFKLVPGDRSIPVYRHNWQRIPKLLEALHGEHRILTRGTYPLDTGNIGRIHGEHRKQKDSKDSKEDSKSPPTPEDSCADGETRCEPPDENQAPLLTNTNHTNLPGTHEELLTNITQELHIKPSRMTVQQIVDKYAQQMATAFPGQPPLPAELRTAINQQTNLRDKCWAVLLTGQPFECICTSIRRQRAHNNQMKEFQLRCEREQAAIDAHNATAEAGRVAVADVDPDDLDASQLLKDLG